MKVVHDTVEEETLSGRMRYSFFSSLLTLCLLVSTDSENSMDIDSSVLRVAFIFAGAVRSFKFPIVHETLRWNLINAFCPKHLSCVPDVIARVSITDNIHKGFNATGRMESLGEDKARIDKIKVTTQHALSRLLLIGGMRGHLVVDWTDIGSEKERAEMEKRFPSDQRHKTFRLLDSRRYSMYFNRFMAYELAMKQEKSYGDGVKYDWIVHARLDGVWGEPIQDLTKWSSSKVYVPNSWASEVPDTFALLPRKYADDYYSMDQLMMRGVFCLGGGNFDPNTLKASYLINTLHFTLPEVIDTQRDDCNLLHRDGDSWNEDKYTGIKWAEDGLSEQILKRKLKKVGISLEKNTLAFHPFFTVTVRPHDLSDICLYLHHFHMIGWARSSQYYAMSIFLGCTVMMNDFRKLHRSSYASCSFDESKYTGDSCLLNPKISKFNFMPFVMTQGALGSVNGENSSSRRCVSASNGKVDDGVVALSTCLMTQTFGDMVAVFHSTQLIHFYPHLRVPQKIRVLDTQVNPAAMCFTVQTDSLTVILSKCIEDKTTKEGALKPAITQEFKVNMIRTFNPVTKSRYNFVQLGWVDYKDGDETNFCVTTPSRSRNTLLPSVALELETCHILRSSSSRLTMNPADGSIFLHSTTLYPYADRTMFQIERVNSTVYLRP